jgi:uncharacterized protein YggU (UPF0235/DUF167 family)
MASTIEIKVVPGSGRQRFVLDKSGVIKCFLKSPAEQGKANEELMLLLSKALAIPQKNIRILLGAKSRKKIVQLLTDMTYDQIIAQLGIEQQKTILE